MKYVTVFLVVIALSGTAFSQVTEQWVSIYDSVTFNYLHSKEMCVDGDGNIYVTGSAYGSPGGLNFLTVKYNSSGDEVWVRTYNGNYADEAYAITIDNSGNVYVTGRSQTTSAAASNYDISTVMYNSEGVEQWVRRYSGPGNRDDAGRAIEIDNSGNVYVGGSSDGGSSTTRSDFTLIKYNADGDTLWVRRYDRFERDDNAYTMKLDADGNIYLAGGSSGPGSIPADYLILKYNPDGELEWARDYDGPGNSGDAVNDIAIDNLGNIYVTGSGRGITSHVDYATIKYSPSGDELWVRRYDNERNNSDDAAGLAIDNAGGIYVTGESVDSSWLGSNATSYATIKYNSEGDTLWIKKFNGYGRDTLEMGIQARPWDIAVDDSGNAYVTGQGQGKGTIAFNEGGDYLTIKYSTDGDELWSKRYEGPYGSWDRAKNILVDKSGNVYITGNSVLAAGTYGPGYVTIKYSQGPTSAETITNEIPQQFELLQNYPNPFNPSSRISFNLPVESNVSLKIFNILGQEIVTLVNKNLPAGYQEINFDASGFNSGVYLYRVEGKSIDGKIFSGTRKMMLLK